MKHNKLLSALILCCAISLPVCATAKYTVGNGESFEVTGTNETSNYTGNVINNSGIVTVKSGVEFSNNTIDADWGSGTAIYNNGGSVTTEAVTFIRNGIKNTPIGEITINGSSGGAIASWNGGTVTIGEGSSFIENGFDTAKEQEFWGYGGAIYIDNDTAMNGKLNIGGDSSETNFSGNSATAAGAIYTGVTTEINNTVFSDNKATGGKGGAIYAYGNYDTQIKVDINSSAFNRNYSGTDGGAITNVGSVNSVIQNSAFSNNTSGRNGGAIANIGYETERFSYDALGNPISEGVAQLKSTLKVTDSTFTQNSAVNGGAIYNALDNFADSSEANKQEYAQIDVAGTFSKNTAIQNGGAIYNDGYANIHDATFTANSAREGGALYNAVDGKIDMKDVTYNAANGSAKNDIFNAGTINVTGATDQNIFASNITIADSGKFNFEGASVISGNISGAGAIINNGQITLSGDNSHFTGTYTSSGDSVTTVTDKYFSGDREFSAGTLNWYTTKNDALSGAFNVTGGDLHIGGTQAGQEGILNLGSESSIAEAANVVINQGSVLNLQNGAHAALNTGDTWAGKIILGASGAAEVEDIDNITATATSLSVSGLASTGVLQANNGYLKLADTIDIKGESYIEKAVAMELGGNIKVSDGGKIVIDDNDKMTGASPTVTLSEGGTLNYGKTEEAGLTILANDGGNLNLLAGSKLAFNASNIADTVAIDIQKDATLSVNNSTLNLDSMDKWNGNIINANGIVNANNLIKTSNSATLTQTGGELNLYNGTNLILGEGSKITDGIINITKDNADSSIVGTSGSSLTVYGNDDIQVITGGDMTIDKDSAFVVKSGTFALNSLTGNGALDSNGIVQAALVNTMNGESGYHIINNLTSNTQTNFNIDIYARSNMLTDNDEFEIGALNGVGKVMVKDWALNGDIFGWDAPIDRNITLSNIFVDKDGNAILSGNIAVTNKETFTPIGWYKLNKNDTYEDIIEDGVVVGRRLAGSTYSLNLSRFNPQVFRGQVATVAQWMNQLAIDDMLFNHTMLLPSFKEESGNKPSKAMANQYSAINPLFSPYQYSVKDGGLWYKMYGTFEHLNMNNGLGRVGNNSYGALIGADFGLKELKNGWKFMPTAYLGYNGAHQYWSGMGQYQNGGQAGLMGTWYKDNFIVSALAYGGVYDNSMDVHGHSENTFNYFAGTAAKSAYNWKFHKNWILQPNLMASYNYFGQQNWHSDFGQMGMMAGMLHGVNIAPGVNLIWEKDTFSTYLTLQYMYNVNGASGGRAGNVGLPQIEMDRGYIQYGIGFTKKFTDRASGYLQAVLRNVGRTGVGFQAGFNIKLGK